MSGRGYSLIDRGVKVGETDAVLWHKSVEWNTIPGYELRCHAPVMNVGHLDRLWQPESTILSSTQGKRSKKTIDSAMGYRYSGKDMFYATDIRIKTTTPRKEMQVKCTSI